MNSAIRLVLALSLTVGLPCCGGGGGGGADGPPVGSLMGVSIGGLEFETDTQRGLTGASGQYTYLPGETITFRFGTLELGSVPAGQSLSLLDLCPGVTLPLTNGHARNAIQHDRAFIKLANLATLIYFLDADSNPSNGIQVSTLLDGADLDLTLPVDKFRTSLALRTLRKDGLSLGVWGGVGHPIPLTDVVLDQLYKDLGVQHRFYRIAEGRVDIDDDGVADEREVRTYDALGKLVRQEFIEPSDGSILDGTSWVYDASGRVLQEPSYLAGTFSYTYDENGHPTTKTQESNGLLVDRLVTHYDSLGNPLFETLKEPSNPIFPQERTWTYDANGVLLSDIHLFNYVGNMANYTTTYDTRGNPVTTDIDFGQDGSVEVRGTMTWNADCLLTMREREELDGAGLTLRQTYTHDADGRLLEGVAHDIIDDEKTRCVYTYVGLAPYATFTDFRFGDEVYELWRRSFDAHGNITLEEHDSSGNGTVEYTSTVDYDETGWPLRADITQLLGLTIHVEFTSEPGTWTSVLYFAEGVEGMFVRRHR